MSARSSLPVISLEGAVVEDVAVLVDLDERGALVGVGPAEGLHHVLAVHVVGPGHEGGLGAEGQAERVERVVERAERRRLGDLAHLRGRRVLALGQAVDLVVEQQDGDVHVAAQGVDQVVAADRQRVAVAGDDPDVEVRAGWWPGRWRWPGPGRGSSASRRCSCSTGSGRRSRCPRGTPWTPAAPRGRACSIWTAARIE